MGRRRFDEDGKNKFWKGWEEGDLTRMGRISSEKDGNKEFWLGWEKWVLKRMGIRSFDLDGKNEVWWVLTLNMGKIKGISRGEGGLVMGGWCKKFRVNE